MAFLLPNPAPPHPTLLQLQSKDKPILSYVHLSPPPSSSSPLQSSTADYLSPSITDRRLPISHLMNTTTSSPQGYNNNQRNDFYLNLGLAVRTLREDLPLLFSKDLNYDIYRDDITFVDPLNTFTGIENYKLIFWGLRFHGRILFKEIWLEVYRVWQPSENVILIRWNLMGVPRVPWEAKGQFQGTSKYKLDRNGKIYEHKVDNLAFNFPQPLKPSVSSVLDLVVATPTPNPTFLWDFSSSSSSSSWVEFYRAVRDTLDYTPRLIPHDCLPTC